MGKGYMRDRGNNKWQLEVDLGKKLYGKGRNRKYKTVTAKSEREASLKLAKFVVKVTGEGYIDPEKINFVDFVNKHWLPKCAKDRLAHTTLPTYTNRLKNRILPAFQHFRLDEIKPIHIIDFISNLKEDGMRLDGKPGKLSASSVYFHYRILNNIFNFAKEIHFLKESPLKGVEKPQEEYKEVDVYDTDEVIELLEALEQEVEFPHWQVIIKLAITTGMRKSELYGLEFKHIDMDSDDPTISIRQALTYSKEQGLQIHDIKKASRSAKQRDVGLSTALIQPIKKLRLQRKKERLASGEMWRDGKYDLLLCHPNGKPYNPSAMPNWWRNFLKRHGLKYINIHALRHTSATMLINEGVHPKVISERLGHSDIKTTMNVYGHVLRKADFNATKKIDDAIFGDNKTQ